MWVQSPLGSSHAEGAAGVGCNVVQVAVEVEGLVDQGPHKKPMAVGTWKVNFPCKMSLLL